MRVAVKETCCIEVLKNSSPATPATKITDRVVADEVVRPEALQMAAKRLIKDASRHRPKLLDRTMRLSPRSVRFSTSPRN